MANSAGERKLQGRRRAGRRPRFDRVALGSQTTRPVPQVRRIQEPNFSFPVRCLVANSRRTRSMRNARVVIALMLLAIPAISQTYDPKLFGGMHWRNIGP